MKYSLIIPVYNRPDEVDELLQSLTEQRFKDFEVIVVEDGSAVPCKDVVEKYTACLDIHYYNKPNSGPGQTRNYGVERSQGTYVLILDSGVYCRPVIWKLLKQSWVVNRQMPSEDPTGHMILLQTYRKPSTMP